MTPDLKQLAAIPRRDQPCHIVVAAAHHDDIEFGCAGSVARWIRDEGATVTYVIVTDGGSGSNEPDIKRADLVATRREEQLEAARIVGVTDVRFLDYPDGALTASLDLRRDITRVIRETKPYRVVCQDPTTVFVQNSYINHPDHRAAGEATLYACFPSAETRPIFPELLAEGLEPHKIGELYLNLSLSPTHYHDISCAIDLKLDALAAHVTQLGSGDDFENGARKWIRQRNRETGERVGVEYAELFRILKFDDEREDQDDDAANSD